LASALGATTLDALDQGIPDEVGDDPDRHVRPSVLVVVNPQEVVDFGAVEEHRRNRHTEGDQPDRTPREHSRSLAGEASDPPTMHATLQKVQQDDGK
jgi:hypothetical protein